MKGVLDRGRISRWCHSVCHKNLCLDLQAGQGNVGSIGCRCPLRVCPSIPQGVLKAVSSPSGIYHCKGVHSLYQGGRHGLIGLSECEASLNSEWDSVQIALRLNEDIKRCLSYDTSRIVFALDFHLQYLGGDACQGVV